MVKTIAKTRPSADVTRQKIVSVAQKLFAQKGFAGTSISNIAGKAKINQSLIYHHFGSKESLWRLVKLELLENFLRVNAISMNEWLEAQHFNEFIELFINTRFNFYRINPDVLRMIIWQTLEPGHAELRGISQDEIRQLIDKIAWFQTQGELDPQWDSAHILLVMLALSIAPFAHAPIFPELDKSGEEKNHQAYLYLILNLLKKGL